MNRNNKYEIKPVEDKDLSVINQICSQVQTIVIEYCLNIEVLELVKYYRVYLRCCGVRTFVTEDHITI